MAMTECRECGSEVSDKADQCPNCGVEAPGKKWYQRSVSGCGGCGGILVLIIVVAWIAGSLSEPTGTTSPSGADDFLSTPDHVERYAHQTINVRAGPGTGNEVVTQLAAGDRAYVESRTSNWTVLYGGPASNDTVGYVLGELLENAPPPDLEVLSTEWDTGEYGNDYAVGRIRNNSSQTYDYVQVSINVYDASGTQIGSTMTNVNNLEPGGVWRFEALIHEDNAQRFRIKDVTGF